MEIQYSEMSNGIHLIKLIGDLDIMGVNEIEIKFTSYCSGENVKMVVDLSDVEFLASIGIRLLITNAKSIFSRNGRMVLLNPNDDVKNVLDMTAFKALFQCIANLNQPRRFCLGNYSVG
jgi:anti-sigma B factor antagonist